MKTTQLLITTCVALMLTPFANAQKQHAFIWNSSSGMTDLGTLGGNTSYALGINNSGEVVGYSYLADNVTTHAFTWTSSGGMVDLGSLPGGSWTHAEAINSAGDLAGEGLDANGKQVPLYWSPSGGFVSLGENVGDSRNYGFGINDSNEMTGQKYQAEVVRAYTWSPTQPSVHDIGTLPWGIHSVGNAINNLQHVTGTASTAVVGRFDAFFWTRKTGMLHIGSIAGGTYTAGEGINDTDEVTGFGVNTTGKSIGFYWSQSTGMTLLQTLGGIESVGFHITSSGAIAGYSSNAAGSFHAALWANQAATPQDLGTLPGGANSYARGINSAGQVVGYADVP
jgi:probable HAF family extracellular repeat protein